MALRIVADALTDLPEGLRAAAKQEGTVFAVATMPEGWAIEDIGGLKRAVTEARSERDAAKRLAKAFEGLDPEKAADAREALEKLAAGQLRGSKEIDEFKASVEKKMADERAALQSKLNARTDALRERMVRGELAPIVAKLGGSDSMDEILALASRHIRVEEAEDGSLKTSIVDREGKPRVTKKGGSAEPLGFDELVAEMRDASGTRGLFRVSATGGAGSSSQAGGSGRAAGSGDQTRLSPEEKIRRGLDRAART